MDSILHILLIICVREIATRLEILKVALGCYAALFQHNDAVAMLDSTQAVGNDNTCTFQFGQILYDNVLTDVVEC